FFFQHSVHLRHLHFSLHDALPISAPFALVVLFAPFKTGTFADPHAAPSITGLGLVGGVLVAMWNYMGWDNASTIAQEVERPQRKIGRAPSELQSRGHLVCRLLLEK